MAATRLARAASPGNDGWTRELLVASFCKPTVALFESMVNSLAINEAPPAMMSLMRSAKIAAWRKSAANWDQRVVGMSSAIAKVVWKILTAQHLSFHNLTRNIATFSKGGAIGVIRWAEAAYTRGDSVLVADVVDAYWAVDRVELMQHLVDTNSPLTYFFAAIYGEPAACNFGAKCFRSSSGIIPGCGGGSLLFAIEMQRQTKTTFSDPKVSAMYADDIVMLGEDRYRDAERAVAPKKLAKLRAVSHGPLSTTFRSARAPAIKLLGAYIGDVAEAQAMFQEDVQERLQQLTRIVTSQVSMQTKWALIRTVELGIRWKFAASNPQVTNVIASQVDDAIFVAITALTEGTPNHKSMDEGRHERQRGN